MSSSLLSTRLKASCKLQLIDTMKDRLAINYTLRNWTFGATIAHTNHVYDITLLGLAWLCARAVVLPATHPQQKAHQGPMVSSCTAPGCTCTHPSCLPGGCCQTESKQVSFSLSHNATSFLVSIEQWNCPVWVGIIIH
jgi:hypothetical protein